MINPRELSELIDRTLGVAHEMISKSDRYRSTQEPMASVFIVLLLLKNELVRDSSNIHPRVLRAMQDLGGSSVKTFENTPLEDAIGWVTEYLYNNLDGYKELEPLRGEFGKGKPI